MYVDLATVGNEPSKDRMSSASAGLWVDGYVEASVFIKNIPSL